MMEKSERHLLLSFLFSGSIVILIAVLAINKMQQPVEVIPVEELPLAESNGYTPTPEACEQAGGTVYYERTQVCDYAPSVTDACEFPIPCFVNFSGTTCTERRQPVCSCMKNADCPTAFTCSGESEEHAGRCVRTVAPKPLVQ